MAYNEQMKSFAKNLYLTPKVDGSHKYTFQQIVEELKDEFPDESTYPDRSSIYRWSREKTKTDRSWKQIWDQGVIRGIEYAKEDIKEIQKEQNAEEAMENRISSFNRRIALIGYDMVLKGYKPVQDKDYEPENVDEGLRVANTGLKILNMQQKEVEQTEDKVINVIFKTSEKKPIHIKELEKDTEEAEKDVE